MTDPPCFAAPATLILSSLSRRALSCSSFWAIFSFCSSSRAFLFCSKLTFSSCVAIRFCSAALPLLISLTRFCARVHAATKLARPVLRATAVVSVTPISQSIPLLLVIASYSFGALITSQCKMYSIVTIKNNSALLYFRCGADLTISIASFLQSSDKIFAGNFVWLKNFLEIMSCFIMQEFTDNSAIRSFHSQE